MAIRVVNGNTSTEDGWPLVDQAGCTWIAIPGTNPPVRIQAQTGIPCTLFAAWVADLNAFVEIVRDADTASWTEGNSVLGSPGKNNGSNHLGGTAVDVDWGDHPMGPAYAGYSQAQIDTIREMTAFYTTPSGLRLIFWAEDWDTPKDSMHFQLGYDTFGRQNEINTWIAQNIRPDGFSMFRRAGAPSTPPAAQVLAAATGLSMGKVNEILPTLQQGLQLAQCNTVNRIAMFIAQTRHEADDYKTTVEYGTGQRYAPYIGRTWIQITWQSNYAKFGQWAAARGLINDPNQFVNDPQSLGDIRWAGIGAAWYWVTPHDGHNLINDDSDRGDVRAVTYTINGGYNGLDQRIAYWNQARAQGDALLTLLTTGDEDDMAGWDQPKVDRAMVLLENIAGVRRVSRSALRWPGEGEVDTCAGFSWSTDGSVHVQLVEKLAVEYGDPNSVALLVAVASCDGDPKFPDRQADAKLAARILTKVPADAKAAGAKQIQAWLDAEKAK
jgi:putative chitinase